MSTWLKRVIKLNSVERRKYGVHQVEGGNGSRRRGTRRRRGRTGNGNTAETVGLLDAPDVSDGVGREEADGVGDEAVLEPEGGGTGSVRLEKRRKTEVYALLDSANHVGLHLRREVVVDDTETSEELSRKKEKGQEQGKKRMERGEETNSDGDSHVGLGDSVHGGGEEGSLENRPLGDPRLEGDCRSGEVDVARKTAGGRTGQPECSCLW
jgi:hypothetical protein